MKYIYETTRARKRVTEILEKYSNTNYRLFSVVMGDVLTRFEMIFEHNEDNFTKYQYKYVSCHINKKVQMYLNEYSAQGYRLAFHVMGYTATRHELFFEKEIE